MRSITRRIMSVMVPLMLAGCEDFLSLGAGPDDDDMASDVAVTTDVRPDDNIIAYTVRNSGPDTVYLTGAYLERREGSEWRWVDAGEPRALVLYILPISSAEEFSIERPIEDGPDTLSPGEYRYRLLLFEDRKTKKLLPGRARTSNAVTIE